MIGLTDDKNYQDIADAIREKNGSEETYKPSEMAEAIRGIEGGGELDFSKIYDADNADYVNNLLKDAISYAKTIKNSSLSGHLQYKWSGSKIMFFPQVDLSKVNSLSNAFAGCYNLVYVADIVSDKITDFQNLFFDCHALKKIKKIHLSNCTSMYGAFYQCYTLKSIDEWYAPKNKSLHDTFFKCYLLTDLSIIDTANVTDFGRTFSNCRSLKKIELTSVKNATTFNNMFEGNVGKLEEVYFTEWLKGSISISGASLLKAESIHYIIQNAKSVADGATARTLTLHATAKANWETSEYYEQDLAVLEEKGITIA